MNLNNLFSDTRRKNSTKKDGGSPDRNGSKEARTEIERDYDRILFSTPVRRLADKTQVFPLDKNDSVRNRLTHSHEVSNLARSIGTALVISNKKIFSDDNCIRNIPALLAAVGLIHDLGNPPFGHQGEAAIRTWFKKNKSMFKMDEKYLNDFINFDGNAQTIRLSTRLQLINDGYGLDLTYATLASMMKYTVSSSEINKEICCQKKHGFFQVDKTKCKEILEHVGLRLGLRHPMAYIMEACDDIAYASIDIEDCVKKGLASFNDVVEYLERENASGDELVSKVVKSSREKYKEYADYGLSPFEHDDISTQRFRVYAIAEMVTAVNEFLCDEENLNNIFSGGMKNPILESSPAAELRRLMGKFTKEYAFGNKTVLELELKGYNTITELLNIFWFSISQASSDDKGVDKKAHPFARYVYSRISENYRRVFENPLENEGDLPLDYRRCLLMTDMISGMTDNFAFTMLSEFKALMTDETIKLIHDSNKCK